MSLLQQINSEYVEAYKAKDSVKVGVLRLLKTAIKNKLVELRRPDGELTEEEVLDVVLKQAKQRQDSIEQYTAANRPDLAAKENAELDVLKGYLPQMLENEALLQVVEDAMLETAASGPKDMGKVIGAIMTKYRGRVDGRAVSEAVKKRLVAK